jgi:predicted enzyme related to lactoylglutathione lyase
METTAKNPVVHFEVLGRDAGALQSFYSQAFGWPLAPAEGPMEYTMVHFGGGGIDGGIGKAPQGPGHATFYVGVSDLGATLEQVERLGGTTVQPPTEIPEGVTFALFADPEGHVVGLVRE